MATCAQQVVQALAAQLVDAATPVGDDWHTDRLWPTSDQDLPDGLVFAGDERITYLTVHTPRVQVHELDLLVAVRVRAVTGMDAALDEHAVAVRQALFATEQLQTLGGLLPAGLQELQLVRRIPEPDELRDPQDSEFALGRLMFTLRASFQTLEDDPETFA
jgi:hypothetical protein